MSAVAAELRRELARYRADYLAARAPLAQSVIAGGLAALGVYAFPFLIITGSGLVVRLIDLLLVAPLGAIFRLFRLGVYREGRVPEIPAGVPTPTPTAPPLSAAERPLEGQTAGDPLLAAALVLFWPLVMLLIGAVAAAVYRWRRARRLAELERHPLEFNILPEVVLFYLLTTAAGLLVGVDRFLAVAANVAFSWAGYVIWRWLYDFLLGRLAPAPMRAQAAARAAAEADYRHRQQEGS
ncbi:MAG TPA: hypothetical protein VHS99_16990 [Chloroflexota bacterium]|nr:hypothetical protein [Chloroflexota bacterium]